MRVLLLSLLIATPALAAPRVQPELPSPDARYSTGTTVTATDTDAWWTLMNDPALDGLVKEALENSPDLGSAQARMNQAAGATMGSLSPLLPSASFDVGVSGSPSANAANQISPQLTQFFEDIQTLMAQLPGPPADDPNDDEEEDPDVTWNGSALLNLGLNIDFGSSALKVRAARLDEAAAKGDRDGAARLLVQQVVASWLDVRNARARVRIVEGQIETNRSLLELTRRRFEGGDARGLDVLQQQQQLASTRALLPQSNQILRLREVQLATLLGRDPAAPNLPDGVGLPELSPQPGLGTPADLLLYLLERLKVEIGLISFLVKLI